MNCRAQAGDEAALEEQRRRSRKSSRVQARRRARRRVHQVQLRTAGDLFALLERSALDVLNSAESASTKANAVRGIVAGARELIAADLEGAAAEFERLLVAHPELRARIKAVP